MLIAGWAEHFRKPIEDQVLIDQQRLVPVFETIRLYRRARAGELDL